MISDYNFGGYRVPYLYSTNGEVVRFRDARDELNLSCNIKRFHTPKALLEFMGRDLETSLDKLRSTPNDHPRIVARPYQVEANAAIERAIAERKRHMLVAMATGTGKTFMTANEIYRLMKSGVAKRILFLVDRRALAAQAVRTFATFEPCSEPRFGIQRKLLSSRGERESSAS